MSEDRKFMIGRGHLAAMGRMGLAELRGAVYPESNIAQPPQMGLAGVWTPGEVMAAKQDEVPQMQHEQEASAGPNLLDARLAEIRQEMAGRELEPEREKEIDR